MGCQNRRNRIGLGRTALVPDISCKHVELFQVEIRLMQYTEIEKD